MLSDMFRRTQLLWAATATIVFVVQLVQGLLVLMGLALLLLLSVTLILLLPAGIHDEVQEDAWIHQLRGFVSLQKSMAQWGQSHPYEPTAETFDPYLAQLDLVSNLFRAGDRQGTYAAMNRLMDVLEAREGGIPDETAEAIWHYCYRVTPAAYHDVSRHLKARDTISDRTSAVPT